MAGGRSLGIIAPEGVWWMLFEALGPLRVGADGREPAGGLQRVLLGVLLARANTPVSKDLLVDAMWGDRPDPRALKKLQFHVHKLRRVLGADRLDFGPAGYRLRVLDGESDVATFTAMVDEALATEDPRRRAATLRAALDLWRGEPYEGVDTPALAEETRRLSERRAAALELWYEAEIAAGNHDEILGPLTETARAYPLRERLYVLLMTALHQAGRRVDALAVYRGARRTLVEELGIEPGPELREAEARILTSRRPAAPRAVAPPSAPAQLPRTAHGLVGREAELALLDESLAGCCLTVLAGTAGVGKTALAVHWANRVRPEFPDGQLYVDLCGYGPGDLVAPEEALAGFLLALGVGREAQPRGLTDRAARFRTAVDGRRLLLVLDNARTAEQVRPLLPGTSSVFVLVTSRDQLTGLVARDGARRVGVDRLPAASARELLIALAGERIGVEEADTLVRRCARLPLALRVAAELIRSSPDGSAATLLAELAEEQSHLDALDIAGDQQASVRSVLSWSYQHLPADAARMFRLCALHPGTEFDTHTLAALAGVSPAQARRQAGLLVAASLLDRTASGRHRPHDLLRGYAEELVHLVDTEADRRAARARLFDLYQRAASAAMDLVDPAPRLPRPVPPPGEAPLPGMRTMAEALRWLDAELPALVTTARQAVEHGWPHVPVHLSATLDHHLAGQVEQGTAVHQAALLGAHRLGDRLAEARASRRVSASLRHGGDLAGALDLNERARELFRDEGDQYAAALTLANLGWVHHLRGDYYESLGAYQRAWRAIESTGDAADTGLGLVLTGLGAVHLELANLDDAVECLTLALEIAAAEGSPRREGRIRRMLGSANHRLGHLDLALADTERAARIATEVNDRVCLAQLSDLGRVYWDLGRRADAFATVSRVVEVARENGSRVAESCALLALGDLHLLDHAPAEAARAFASALELSAHTGVRRDQARALDGLGDAAAALEGPDTALTHWRRALAIFTDLDVPEAAEVGAKLARVSPPASPPRRRAHA